MIPQSPHLPWFRCGQSQGRYWPIAWDSASGDSASSNRRRHSGLERNHISAHPRNHTHGLGCFYVCVHIGVGGRQQSVNTKCMCSFSHFFSGEGQQHSCKIICAVCILFKCGDQMTRQLLTK